MRINFFILCGIFIVCTSPCLFVRAIHARRTTLAPERPADGFCACSRNFISRYQETQHFYSRFKVPQLTGSGVLLPLLYLVLSRRLTP